MSVDQRTGHRLFLSLLPWSEPLTALPSACLLRLSGHGAELIFVVRSAKCECLTPTSSDHADTHFGVESSSPLFSMINLLLCKWIGMSLSCCSHCIQLCVCVWEWLWCLSLPVVIISMETSVPVGPDVRESATVSSSLSSQIKLWIVICCYILQVSFNWIFIFQRSVFALSNKLAFVKVLLFGRLKPARVKWHKVT